MSGYQKRMVKKLTKPKIYYERVGGKKYNVWSDIFVILSFIIGFTLGLIIGIGMI
jgi:hypothetical protein